MDYAIQTDSLCKSYGKITALLNINLTIPVGSIVGIIGPNGAGKTSLLRALTGLIDYEGQVSVLGLEPKFQRSALMQVTGVVHDISILPPWMTVQQVVDFQTGLQPKFDRDRFEFLLKETNIGKHQKVKHLSKGMKTQLHLALVMATEAQALIMDEPTHGLDILFRKKLYSSILMDFYTENKTILISTHQVEDVEHILSDVIFIKEGKIFLNESRENLDKRFLQVTVKESESTRVRALNPVIEYGLLGQYVFILEDVDRSELEKFGTVKIPSVSDIFAAMMEGVS